MRKLTEKSIPHQVFSPHVNLPLTREVAFAQQMSEGEKQQPSPLTLTHSLLCGQFVLSSTTSFLSNSGKKRGKETPQGTDGSLTSYVLRTRTHSTSQKSIAVGSYFWGVVGPLSCKSCRQRQAKCCIDFPLTRSAAYPCQNVGALLLTFLKSCAQCVVADKKLPDSMQNRRVLTYSAFLVSVFFSFAGCSVRPYSTDISKMRLASLSLASPSSMRHCQLPSAVPGVLRR